MGGKQSSNNNNNSREQGGGGSDDSPMASGSGSSAGLGLLTRREAGSSSEARQRARSLSNVLNGHSGNGQPISISPHHTSFEISGSPHETDRPVEMPVGRVYAAHSLPVQLLSFHGMKCPICSKFVQPDDVECHLVMCLTKPRIIYNEDVLTEDKGECVICLDDLTQGDTIARLPCLCIYHKVCIDAWFKVNRSCPEHPVD